MIDTVHVQTYATQLIGTMAADANPYRISFSTSQTSLPMKYPLIFYSENHFSGFRDCLGGLSGLNSLPQGVPAKMIGPSICLNFFNGDGYGREFGPETNKCHAVCSASKRERLFTIQNAMMRCLHHGMATVMSALEANIQPDRLKLYFICDSADLEICAEEVLVLFFTTGPLLTNARSSASA